MGAMGASQENAIPGGLRAGDWVEVRSAEEILKTLDDQKRLDALPFMPEMLQYCGRRFRVFKSAHKTCDTIHRYVSRGMERAVHLEGLRCDGQAHDGCQAACLIFWKEAWLKPVPAGDAGRAQGPEPASRPADLSPSALDELKRSTMVPTPPGETGPRYRCQATEMLRATTPLSQWNARHLAKDLTSRNVRLFDFVRYSLMAIYNVIMRKHWRGRPYPQLLGLVQGKTPSVPLGLQAGDLVRVRPREEIFKTLNPQFKNRGLSFDVEMLRFCAKGTYRVLSRVDTIIDEKSGKMLRMPNPCLILDGVTCSGNISKDRLFCPRNVYPYWHEIWLERAEVRD